MKIFVTKEIVQEKHVGILGLYAYLNFYEFGVKLKKQSIRSNKKITLNGVELTKEEADIHDSVFVHEALEQWTDMQKALDKFSRLNPKAYMTLLD